MEKFFKIIIIIFIIFFASIIVYIQKDFVINYFTFNPIIKSTMTGVVVKVNEHDLGVMGENGDFDLYWVSFGEEGNIGFKQGQEILIYYNGFVMEVFPARPSGVSKIEIIKEKSDKQIPDDVLNFFYNNVKSGLVSLKYIDNIANTITVDEAVNNGYFVYDGQNDKVYNKDILDSFMKNTRIEAKSRTSDEICIVIYNANGEPIIYDLFYDANTNQYKYAYDYTRVKSWESPVEESANPEMHYNIITNNIAGENYGIEVVEDKDFNVAIILLKAHNNDYSDIEIARYSLDRKNYKINNCQKSACML